MSGIFESLGRYLPPRVLRAASGLPPEICASADELRLRRDSAASVTCGTKNIAFDSRGRICEPPFALRATAAELEDCMERLCSGSYYTCEESAARGFVPLPEGGRAGICGRALTKNGGIAGWAEIYSVSLRLHRFVRDAAMPLARFFAESGLCGVMVVSPPGGGKTTFLRSAAYLLANGAAAPPLRVALADEREELSVSLPRSGYIDILSAAPKAEAISVLTRTMAPQVIICDEISPRECASVLKTQNCGAFIIASAHGKSPDDLYSRPGMRELLESGAFGATAVLARGERPAINRIMR